MLKTRNICIAIVLVFLLFLVFFVAGFFKNSEEDAGKRSKIEETWLKSTREVVQKINDQEATEEFQFIEKNLILATPNKKGVQFLEGAKSNTWLAIVPLLKKDKKVSEQWRDLFSANTAAHFLPGARAIVVKDYVPYSPAGKAIVFLHEGYHACNFIKNPYGEQSEKEYCYEEVRTHTFQNKVMSLLGGKKYQAVLDKEVKRISSMAKKSGDTFSVPNRIEYDKDLAVALGKPASQPEKDFIQTSVWIHAVFVFLDKSFEKDAEDHKALFLKTLYREGGIF